MTTFKRLLALKDLKLAAGLSCSRRLDPQSIALDAEF